MIIQFSIGNYRSFNGIQTINFRATGIVSENKTVDANNIAEVDGQRLLKTLGVYGANASGKSNLVKGFHFFKRMVKWSLNNEDLFTHIYDPNIQAIENKSDDCGYFQVVILIEGRKYRYGFTLGEKEIATEWLFGPDRGNGNYYFSRIGKEIEINEEYFPEGLNIPYDTKLRANTLFLTFCSSYNGQISGSIRDFISYKIKHTETSDNDSDRNADTNKLVEENNKEVVLNWLREAGLDYNDIKIQKNNNRNEHPTIIVYKNIYDSHGKIIGTIPMNLKEDESDGTQKYYSFIGKLYKKFEDGGLLISDEIDSNFHPALLQKIISLFNNPLVNKANAQLLFTSHDTNLMSPEIMRRDQFYFTEKSSNDETVLYSLSDLKGIRNNADFANQYLAGFYGALPVLGDFIEESLTTENPEK